MALTKCADLHMHTCYSHGVNTPQEMYEAAVDKGLALIGFTEHSPRPSGYDYRREYREQLERHFPDYIHEVLDLKKNAAGMDKCQVLLGLEMDWLDREVGFIRKAARAWPYDYLIGSVHFIDKWGFDDSEADWQKLDRERRCDLYEKYFHAWRRMLESGLFQIAAHPDLIKIFSVDSFHDWLRAQASRDLVSEGLEILRDKGMAMEISSAGLRKACREIYPAPEIMRLASDLGVRVTLASDAHNVRDVGADFDTLGAYARSFGFKSQTIFNNDDVYELDL